MAGFGQVYNVVSILCQYFLQSSELSCGSNDGDQLIRDGLEPCLSGVHCLGMMYEVCCGGEGCIVAVRIG